MTGQRQTQKSRKKEKSTPKKNTSSMWLPVKAKKKCTGECSVCSMRARADEHTTAEQLPSAGNICSRVSVK